MPRSTPPPTPIRPSSDAVSTPLDIIEGWQPGAIGRVTELHARYYRAKAGFGVEFEAKVATEMSDFCLRYTPGRDGLWLATADDRIEACVAVAGPETDACSAQLRWFIASDACRGSGVGRKLLTAAIEFCMSRSYGTVHLWTFAGLAADRHLYEGSGFVLEEERLGSRWGSEVKEQRFVKRLA